MRDWMRGREKERLSVGKGKALEHRCSSPLTGVHTASMHARHQTICQLRHIARPLIILYNVVVQGGSLFWVVRRTTQNKKWAKWT